MIDNLPIELLFNCFIYCDIIDIFKIKRVSKYFYYTINNNKSYLIKNYNVNYNKLKYKNYFFKKSFRRCIFNHFSFDQKLIMNYLELTKALDNVDYTKIIKTYSLHNKYSKNLNRIIFFKQKYIYFIFYNQINDTKYIFLFYGDDYSDIIKCAIYLFDINNNFLFFEIPQFVKIFSFFIFFIIFKKKFLNKQQKKSINTLEFISSNYINDNSEITNFLIYNDIMINKIQELKKNSININ